MSQQRMVEYMFESIVDEYRIELPVSVIEAIEEFVLPLVLESMDVTLEAYNLDEDNNDGYTIGSYGWKNLSKRMSRALFHHNVISITEESPNDFVLLIDGFKFRVHKVDPDTLLPKGGKAAKQAAKDLWLALPFMDQSPKEQTSLYLGYVVDPDFGVKKAFLANMVAAEMDSDKVFCVPLHTYFNYDEQLVDSGVNVNIPEVEPTPKQLVARRLPKNSNQYETE